VTMRLWRGRGEDEERGSPGEEVRERGGLPLAEDWAEEDSGDEDRGERSAGRAEGM
jgi:hypothetical protein